MKMKFFERSYILTLVLFLVFFNGAIFLLEYYTYQNNLQSEIQIAWSEQYLICESYERDHSSGGKHKSEALQNTYGKFYFEKGIMLAFHEKDSLTFSNITEGASIPQNDILSIEKVGGRKHIIISKLICNGDILLTYAKDINKLDEDYRSLMFTFGGVSLAVSFIFGLLLYYLQRRLLIPLENLRKITKDISNGNYEARADVSGDDEFSQLAQDFNFMTDKINEQIDELKNAASQKQTMLDNLAHELRTPLTTIYGYAEYAHGVKLGEEALLRSLRNIMSESKRLKNISDTLLDSAFIRENGIEQKNISIGAILLRTIERFNIRTSECGVSLKYRGGTFNVFGDETLLEIVISNLTENAIRASREGGVIEIGTDAQKKSVFVKDNGIGLSEEQLKHLTEPFYRTDKSRNSRDGGTGLGLALCKRIADAHGADLIFESELNVGTTVTLVFNGGDTK